jgi:transcriptional regulator
MIEKIKEFRKEFGLSQKEVADLLEIKKITYFKYENGQIDIPLSKLIRIAEIFKTTPDNLLGIEKEIGMKEKVDFYESCLEKQKNTLVEIKENADRYSDFYYPVLKNYLDDIIILDINGKLYNNTGKYRKLSFQSDIKKVDLLEVESLSFNPLEYLKLENLKNLTDILVMNCFGETERTNKVKFLSSVIKYYFCSLKTENKDLGLLFNFKEIINYIKSLNSIQGISMVEEFKIFNSHRYFFEEDKEFLEKIGLIKRNNKEDDNLINKGQIPEFHKENLELIELGNEKLIELKKEILSNLYIFSNERVSANMRKDDLHLRDMKKETKQTPTSLYFVVDKDEIESLNPIIRMFYAIIFYEYTKKFDVSKPRNTLITIENIYDRRMLSLEKSLEKLNVNNINNIKFYAIVDEDKLKEKSENIEVISVYSDYLKIGKKDLEFIYKKSKTGKYKEIFSNGNIEIREVKI